MVAVVTTTVVEFPIGVRGYQAVIDGRAQLPMSSPLENLTRRFCPPLEPALVKRALAESGGHAGRAAKLLRELSKDPAAAGASGGGASVPPPAAPRIVELEADEPAAAAAADGEEEELELDAAAVELASVARAAGDPALLKNAGNAFFVKKQFDAAVEVFGEAIKILKAALAEGAAEGAAALSHDLAVIYSNRAAAYLSLESYVRAGNDARLSAELEPTYWKAHWRRAKALSGLSPKIFRTQEAIKALEACLVCPTLPAAQRPKTEEYLAFAQKRLAAQEAATPLPEGCVVA